MVWPMPMNDQLPIAEALRLLRTRKKLSQIGAASRVDGWRDGPRAVSFWETGSKTPSLRLLHRYLRALDLDFADLQHALDQVQGRSGSVVQQFADLDRRMAALEQKLADARVRQQEGKPLEE